jgi:predicted ATP-grasp superfamily ATP-dependent carboligase
MNPDKSTPVVLLRAVSHLGVGLARSFGRWGVPVYAVESGAMTPAFYSRYCTAHFSWSLEESAPEDTLAFLVSIARRLGRRAVLLPTRDQAAIFMAEHRESLEPWFKFWRMSPDLTHSLCSKRVFYAMAERFGVPVPETYFPEAHAEAAEVAERIPYPALLKAADGDRMMRLTGRRMFRVHDAEELLRTFDAIGDPQNVMIQSYIPGPEDSCWIFHGYFDRDSNCVAAYTGKKARQCRAYGGDTAFGITCNNETIKRDAIRFLSGVGYSGIVDACIRFDARDGLYKFLDINPRIGANARMFVSASGMDLARLYYLDITGQTCAAEPVPDGRKWVVEDYDLVSSYRYWRDGNLSVRDWLRSIQHIDEYGYWSLGDPLPAFARIAQNSAELIRRLSGTNKASRPAIASDGQQGKPTSKAA